jgi:thiol-disulfide isomerase/thioredoxin
LVSRQTWKIWVVRENPDHSWRLVLRHGSRFAQERDDAAQKSSQLQPEDISFAWCDVYPDGRIVDNDSFGLRMQPAQVLPRLPDTAADAEGGWKTKDAKMDETYVHRLLADRADGHCTIEIVRESPMQEIYGMESRNVATFDLARGFPEKIASETRQTYGFDGEGEGSLELTDVETHPMPIIVQLAEDAEKYFAAQAAYEKALRRKDLSSEKLKSELHDAVEELQRVGQAIESPELKKLITSQAVQREQNVKYTLEAIASRNALLGKPSEDWKTTDLAGKPHALQDYRGKVVILDFWYRGCGWCIRAMPQMKEVAAHFEGQPVVVFGMNTDQKVDDALFVVEKMGLGYTNLKATGLPEKYKVSGFPTLLILDQEGVIRDIHVGYSPTLRDEVVESVESLLKAKP